jgi:hypothetical protein
MVDGLRGVALAAVMVLAGGAPAGVTAADAAHGRALYEARCGGCHDRSVHARTVRAARSFDEVRGYVVNWDRQIGRLWRDEEVDAVTRYLNERYYRYPCPPAVCTTERG